MVIVILGYIGFGNYGDELLADIVYGKLREKYGSDAEIEFLSSKDSIERHLELLIQAKGLYLVGGIFQDLSGFLSPFYYFFCILFAKLTGSKLTFLAQGIGPLENIFTKLITFISMKIANQISVRDNASSEFLTEMNIEHIKGADLAWLYADEIDDVDDKFKDFKQGSVVLALRDSKKIDDDFMAQLALNLSQSQAPVIALAMQDGDRWINQDLLKQVPDIEVNYINASDFSPYELIYLMKKYASSIYSMRLHALILARIAGLEINAIDCDPKILEFGEQINNMDIDELAKNARVHLEMI